MVQKGYIIFSLDNRGSAGRGHLFEEPIHYRLGAQELSDQLDGVAYLKSLSYVDGNRIGIWGWSYGGHMTLHAMFEASGTFKAGFAGGPVTDWHFYDSTIRSDTWGCCHRMNTAIASLRRSIRPRF